MGRPATAGERPVSETEGLQRRIQSTAGQVKPGGKLGPTLHPKQLPKKKKRRGTEKKEGKREAKKEKKRNLVLTSTQSPLKCDEVLFVERSGELLLRSELKVFSTGGEGRASLNRAI